MTTIGKEGYEPIVQGLRLGPNDGEEPKKEQAETSIALPKRKNSEFYYVDPTLSSP
jgi:hypothetical protein